MSEYLTTKEVAAYLRLNEKKVYALVAEGKLPAARLSGKWIFPRDLIDQWVAGCTVYPASGLMGALLDQMVVIQGSDDWLLGNLVELFQAETGVPIPTSATGSLAGLRAVSDGLAHMAGCHVDNDQVRETLNLAEGCYLVSLFDRQQGLIYDRKSQADLEGLAQVAARGLRWADRQPQSGTYRLVERLFAQVGASTAGLQRVGPLRTHLELALTILQAKADVGLGIQVAADTCGLDFMPLHTERYKLAVPVAFVSHPMVARFMEFLLSNLQSGDPVAGYGLEPCGQLEVIAAPDRPQRPKREAPSPAWVEGMGK
jgi:putative molybdopterin biosynthesis protein